MKVVKKKGTDGMIILDVTVSTAEVSEALNIASINFCSQMHIMPSKDKTPAQAANEQMGIKDLDTVVQPQAIESFVPRALDKHNIVPAYVPVPQPKSILKRGHTYQFELEVMPKPTYELSSYDPVSITISRKPDDTAAIDAEISQLAYQYTEYVATDPHPLAKGDHCKINLKATKDGEPVSGLTSDGRIYSVGVGLMPDGFDENIIGMNVGDVRTFTFEGPGLDADNNEISEVYECTVEIVEVDKEVAPVIDDAWIQKNMPMYKDLASLREDIGKQIGVHTGTQYDDYVRNVAAAELSKRFEGSIADSIYEGYARELTQNLRRQATAQGLSWEQYLEQNGGEQQMNMMLMMETRQQLVSGFSLDALYRHEKLSYNEEDLEDACRSVNPANPKQVRKQMEAAGYGYALRESAERICAAKYLVAHADITVTDAEAPKE